MAQIILLTLRFHNFPEVFEYPILIVPQTERVFALGLKGLRVFLKFLKKLKSFSKN